MLRIAYFITSHGFGHAARASAVMEALLDLHPDSFFEIITTVPIWFFEATLSGHYNYHLLPTDFGLVQTDPLHENLGKTLSGLSKQYPIRDEILSRSVRILVENHCQLAICDISATGIKAAHQVGLPSLLIENFTWDWIYGAYLVTNPEFNKYINYLAGLYQLATFHIKTIPYCDSTSFADLVVNPVSRRKKTFRLEIRHKLGIPENSVMVLVTFGGIKPKPGLFTNLNQDLQRAIFVIPGFNLQGDYAKNMIVLPHQNDFYHPDLVGASDVVIGKIGYSTVAEIYFAGVPFGFIPRQGFRETMSLVEFIQAQISSISISYGQFITGDWQNFIPHLLASPTKRHTKTNGAIQIAEFILSRFTV